MARRAQKDCPLCVPQLSQADHDKVYYHYQSSGGNYPETARLATQLGSPTTARQVRTHLQYHRIIQPAPQGHLRRPYALQEGLALPRRLQEITLLVARVKALSATQLAQLFYWNGTDQQFPTARKACYRDLRRLSLMDFIYRYYPPQTARPSGTQQAKQDLLSFYFLGRDGSPYVEEHEQVTVPRRDWIASPDNLADEFRIMQLQAAANIICELSRQIHILNASDQAVNLPGAPPLHLSFSPMNWYGSHRTSFSFTDPLSGRKETVTPSGISAIGLTAPEKNFQALAPFFYEHDSGAKHPSAYAQQLLGYMYLERSGALSAHFPDLPKRGYFPPVIVVCRDMRRVIAIQDAMQTLLHQKAIGAEQMPVIILTDEATHSSHGLTGQSWLSLWDNSLQNRRYGLLQALLHSCRPLAGALTADDLLKHTP
jgi:hypothetical protein